MGLIWQTLVDAETWQSGRSGSFITQQRGSSGERELQFFVPISGDDIPISSTDAAVWWNAA